MRRRVIDASKSLEDAGKLSRSNSIIRMLTFASLKKIMSMSMSMSSPLLGLPPPPEQPTIMIIMDFSKSILRIIMATITVMIMLRSPIPLATAL